MNLRSELQYSARLSLGSNLTTDMLHHPLEVRLAKECPWRKLLGTFVVGGFSPFGIRLRFLRNPALNSNSCLKATIHCLAYLYGPQMHSWIDFV